MLSLKGSRFRIYSDYITNFNRVLHSKPNVALDWVGMISHTAIANVLLKDKQVMGEFVGIVYDLVKNGGSLDLPG